MISHNCSVLGLPQVTGPSQVFSSIGHWSTAVYLILGLHVIPVCILGSLFFLRVRKQSPPDLVQSLSCLVSIPPVLMVLTTLAILIPSLGKYVEVLLEIVLSLGLVKFLQLSLTLCGGQEGVITTCTDRGILLPIATPPMVCFLPVAKPAITNQNLSWVLLGPYILLGAKAVILVVDVIYLLVDYTPSGEFLSFDNLHNLVSFPIGLVAIYCLNIFLVLINDCLAGNTKRLLGLVILLEFILFDCMRLFFIFLSGTGMLTCVPPYLSQDIVVHFLKNIIKAFLATFIGVPYLSMCAETTQVSKDDKNDIDTGNNVWGTETGNKELQVMKNNIEHEQHAKDVFDDDTDLDLQRSI